MFETEMPSYTKMTGRQAFIDHARKFNFQIAGLNPGAVVYAMYNRARYGCSYGIEIDVALDAAISRMQ
jgi:hypothetical protein